MIDIRIPITKEFYTSKMKICMKHIKWYINSTKWYINDYCYSILAGKTSNPVSNKVYKQFTVFFPVGSRDPSQVSCYTYDPHRTVKCYSIFALIDRLVEPWINKVIVIVRHLQSSIFSVKLNQFFMCYLCVLLVKRSKTMNAIKKEKKKIGLIL